jgi:hypothetical protein
MPLGVIFLVLTVLGLSPMAVDLLRRDRALEAAASKRR